MSGIYRGHRQAAGYPLTTPPEKDLSDHRGSGDNEALWNWLEKEAPHAEAAVLATDSLNYGAWWLPENTTIWKNT